MAQQPDQQQTPRKKQAAEKTHPAQAQPGAPQQRPGRQTGPMNQPGAPNEPGAGKGRKARVNQESATAPGTNVSAQREGAPTPHAKQQVQERKKGTKTPAANAKASSQATPVTAGAGATAAQPVPPAGQQNVQANTGAKAKKPDPQQVQQIKSQHTSFKAQPKPQQVPTVTYNQNYRIQGADQWTGPQYEAFRSYHPDWHDSGWYHSHYPNVTLIAGGYYFFNNGYWFPAWGYSPAAAYYAYDGPIYVGQRAEPPDKVIADVQAVLQQMGYYTGEVDGLLGPLTREALTAYQADQGLTQTAAIDEPTLDTLGMS